MVGIRSEIRIERRTLRIAVIRPEHAVSGHKPSRLTTYRDEFAFLGKTSCTHLFGEATLISGSKAADVAMAWSGGRQVRLDAIAYPSPDSYRLVRTATQSISMSNGPGHTGTHVNIRAGGSFGK